MSTRDELIAQMDIAKKRVDLADSLNRLERNPDFKKLAEHVFKDEVVRGVLSLSQLGLDSAERKELVRRMDAVSMIQGMLTQIKLDSVVAQDDVRQARRYLGEFNED